MLRIIAGIGLASSLCLQAYLLYGLTSQTGLADVPFIWIFLHAVSSTSAAVCIAYFANGLMHETNKNLFLFSLSIGLAIPLLGTAGSFCALLYGICQSNNRYDEDVYWQFTKNADLPFTAPINREASKLDSRGFVEQLRYSNNPDDLYKKVLAANSIKNSFSVDALKAGIKHSDERIRLTAYQSLDKKVTELNKQIQRLECAIQGQDSKTQSNTWLQIASNYWELLTFEKDEPIAREQLLKKASEAVINAVRILPTNRNAHFTLGRIALLQGKDRLAAVAFDRSMALGMPIEKAMPYRAEAAFQSRDYIKVSDSLRAIDDSYKTYPPLRHLAAFWS